MRWRPVVGLPVAVAVVGSVLCGCATPDQWTSLGADWERELAREQARDRPVSDLIEPKPQEPQELPDVDGEGPIPLSIEQAVYFTLRNNRGLRVRQYNPLIAGTFEQIERGVYDPQVFAGFNYRQVEASETTRVTGEQFNSVSENIDGEAGVRQTLPTGTDLELTIAQGRSTSDRSPEQQDARVGLTVTQSLLRGFGPAVNLVGIRQAELAARASEYQLRGFTEALVAEVESTYWLYTLAQEQIAIFERSLELAERQLDEIEQRIDLGDLAPTEAAAARSEVAVRVQALIDARSDLEVQRLRLARLLNPGRADALERQLEPTSAPRFEITPLDGLDDRLALAQRMRADLNESRLRLDQNRLETISTRNGLLPRLDAFFNYGKSGFGTTIRESARAVEEEETFDFTAGLTFTQPIGNRVAEARDLAARARRQQSAAAVSNLMQQVDIDVRLAWTEVERARQQITATGATRALREETVRAEQQRFEVGESTSLLVAQAARDLLESEIEEIEAVVGYRLAVISLYLAEGTLLERRGVAMVGAGPPDG